MVFCFELSSLVEVYMIGQTSRTGKWQQSNANDILVIISQGECSFTMNEKKYFCRTGDVLFIPKQLFYCGQTKENSICSFFYIHFNPKTAIQTIDSHTLYQNLISSEKFLKNMRFTDTSFMPNIYFQNVYLQFKSSSNEYLATINILLEKLIKERMLVNINSQLMISLYTSELLCLLTRLTLDNIQKKSDPSAEKELPLKLKNAILFIRENYNKSIALSDICNYLMVSEQYLIRIFKLNLEMTPIQYINSLKISHAKELIQHSSMSMKEISYEIGIDNPHYFSRLFKKIEKISPVEFKNHNFNS